MSETKYKIDRNPYYSGFAPYAVFVEELKITKTWFKYTVERRWEFLASFSSIKEAEALIVKLKGLPIYV